ncbi:MAG: recombination protein RecR [Candidatus Omnitrophica bacterium]|nr:recombination protein RecR [Candidatus Omnitrophota bacterium]
MRGLPKPMTALIEQFCKMPGIGTRSAQRLTFYILQSSAEDIEQLLRYIREVKENVRFCSICHNLSEKDVCSICSDDSRDASKVCVVEGPAGVISMEKSGAYDGTYHVLLGEISPIDGVGPEDLKINDLIKRVRSGKVKELIIATDFTTEGETTALYLAEVLKKHKVKVTRLSRGVPVGGSLEHADVATLQRAFEERR